MAARAEFARKGYSGATVRAIAHEAGVDPALIKYFFGSKRELFLEVLELPLDPQDVVPSILSGGRDEVGHRLATFAVETLINPDHRERLLGLLRSASQDPAAAFLIRQKLTDQILGPIAQGLEATDASFRAGLAMSQIAGLTLAQYVLGLDALRGASSQDLINAIAPTLQRYLIGPLGDS